MKTHPLAGLLTCTHTGTQDQLHLCENLPSGCAPSLSCDVILRLLPPPHCAAVLASSGILNLGGGGGFIVFGGGERRSVVEGLHLHWPSGKAV